MRASGEILAAATAEMTLAAMASAGVATQAEADALIDEVLAMAEAWKGGELPLAQVAAMTTPRERFLAARFVRPQPPALRDLLEALCAEGGALFDGHGRIVDDRDLAGVRHRRTYEDGPGGTRRTVVRFQATAEEMGRRKPGESKVADRAELARRPAWRQASGLPLGDRE